MVLPAIEPHADCAVGIEEPARDKLTLMAEDGHLVAGLSRAVNVVDRPGEDPGVPREEGAGAAGFEDDAHDCWCRLGARSGAPSRGVGDSRGRRAAGGLD